MNPVLIGAIIVFAGLFALTAVIALKKTKADKNEKIATMNHQELLAHIKKIEVKIDTISERNAIVCRIAEVNRLTINEMIEDDEDD